MGEVNEEWLEKRREKTEPLAYSYSYGYPEMADLTTTEYGPTKGVEVQPKWDIPEKIVITGSLVGGFFTKRQNPNHPISPDEIRDQATKAIEAGASSIHLHARNENGMNTLDIERYREIIEPLKSDYPEMIYNGTTIPFNEGDWDVIKQICEEEDFFEISPVNTTAVYIGDTVLNEPPDEMIERTRLLQENDMKPQIAVYTDGDVDTANRYLIKTGVLEEPYVWVIVPALPGCTSMPNPAAMVEGLKFQVQRIREIPGEHEIVVSAAGRPSSYLANLAILLGCHVRVGTEDTIYKYPHKDERIADNGEEVKKFVQLAEMLGREVATPDECREIFGI